MNRLPNENSAIETSYRDYLEGLLSNDRQRFEAVNPEAVRIIR